MTQNPFHLISTPIPLLPEIGLTTQAGLSADDPEGRRHAGMAFEVWLTVYSPEGALARRWRVERLAPGERRFLDLTRLTAPFGFERNHLCVVHRIPEPLCAGGEPAVPAGYEADFDMYRTVAQFTRPGGGSGGVIYETPPGFNGRPERPGAFLSHSNQVLLDERTNAYLVLLHYSVHAGYSRTAAARVALHAPDGRVLGVTSLAIPPFGVGVLDFRRVFSMPLEKGVLSQYSFLALSEDASLIPLILNTNEDLGGVSVEHTHPPNSYVMLPGPDFARIRRQAISHHARSLDALLAA